MASSKFQGTYRSGAKASEERVQKIKAEVEKHGSFSAFVDYLFDAYEGGELASPSPSPAEPSTDNADSGEVAATVASSSAFFDFTELLEAISGSKEEVISAITDTKEACGRSLAELKKENDQRAETSTDRADITSAPVFVAKPSSLSLPSLPELSKMFTKEEMDVHKKDILAEIIASREAEIEKLDSLLVAIESIKEIAFATSSPETDEKNIDVHATDVEDVTVTSPVTSQQQPSIQPSSPLSPVSSDDVDGARADEVPSMTPEESSAFFNELVDAFSDDDDDVVESVSSDGTAAFSENADDASESSYVKEEMSVPVTNNDVDANEDLSSFPDTAKFMESLVTTVTDSDDDSDGNDSFPVELDDDALDTLDDLIASDVSAITETSANAQEEADDNMQKDVLTSDNDISEDKEDGDDNKGKGSTSISYSASPMEKEGDDEPVKEIPDIPVTEDDLDEFALSGLSELW